MSNILIVIPFHTGDAAQAERLIDFIFAQNGRKPFGHALLVAAPEVHPEIKTKIKLAAEVTFESSELIELTEWTKPNVLKQEKTNRLFRFAAQHVEAHYAWPFLWLEADCAPLKKGWLQTLQTAYFSQPKKFFGSFLKVKLKKENGDEDEKIAMARVGIYPADTINLIGGAKGVNFETLLPFEFEVCELVVPKANKTWLIQQTNFRTGDKAREDSVLLHADKEGLLLK